MSPGPADLRAELLSPENTEAEADVLDVADARHQVDAGGSLQREMLVVEAEQLALEGIAFAGADACRRLSDFVAPAPEPIICATVWARKFELSTQ